MKQLLFVTIAIVFVAAVSAQVYIGPSGHHTPDGKYIHKEPPKPFAYGYADVDKDGRVGTHESVGDENGVIRGFYTVANPDGTQRKVTYVADPITGFHADVETNEEGTKTSAPANAVIKSYAADQGHGVPVVAAGHVIKKK